MPRIGLNHVSLSLTRPPVKILVDHEDEMEIIVECPYCHRPTKVGDTLMISGYVGCDKCYWGKDGLRDTVLYLREHDYQAYLSGEFYTKHEHKEEEEC